jgi:GWxTD domain-containing protein
MLGLASREFSSFGEDIPLMSFEDMLGYLRFFGTPSRLSALRAAPLERRASVWAEFLRATDPIPETPTNEELQAYFGRVREANAQFRMDRNPGWLSDRGMVFVALGEPDQVFERNVNQQFSTTQMASTARLQIWQYRQYNSQLIFYEDAGGWRLTRPSQTEFLSLAARRQR